MAVGSTHADVDGRDVGHVATTGSLVQVPGLHGIEQIPQMQAKPVEQSAWTRQTSENLPAPDAVVVPPDPVAPAEPVSLAAPADPVADPAAPAVPLVAPADPLVDPATPVAPADPDPVLNGVPPHANAVKEQTTDNQRPTVERMGETSTRSWS